MSWALRIVSIVLPVLGSIAVTAFVSRSIAPPDQLGGRIAWWLGLVVVATVSLMLIDRVARRLLPLATLLQISLIFPDAAPSRFTVAMRTGTTKQLERRLRSGEANVASGLAPTQAEAGEAMLELVARLSQHDRFTRGHGERVRAYTALIGEQLGLSDVELSKLQWAGLIHDIGKLDIPSEILNKPGELTDEEFEVIRTHPAAGDRMIEPMREWLGEWADAVVQHHERIDGTGYPAGLTGEQISLGAKIVTVADTFDVITAVRSYKKSMPAEAAKLELTRHAGTQFDPDIVRAFLNVSIGRLRLAMGPLSMLSNLPYIGALTAPAASTATAVAIGATVALGGGVALSEPFDDPPGEIALAADPVSEATTSTTLEDAIVVIEGESATTVASNSSQTTVVERFATTTTTATTNSSTTSPGALPTVTIAPPPSVSTTLLPPTTAATTTTTIDACAATSAGETQLQNADLAGCDLSGRTLDGWSFAGADLTGASLVGSVITNTDLSNATLDQANLTDVSITDANADGTTFIGATAAGATFTNVGFAAADLTNATFNDATFTDSGLQGSTLIDADFDRATFNNSDLNAVVAIRASFDGAQLVGSAMNDSNFSNADFDNAKMTYGDLARSNFTGASMVDAALDSSGIEAAVFSSVNFTDADLWAAWGLPTGTSSATWNNTKCPNGVTGSANCFP